MYTILDFNFYTLVYFFTFYSFCGWCIEVLYYFKNEHHFVNRGFLKGPFCPIYGCSIVSMIIFLDSYKNNIFILFFLAFLLTSVLEYFTGFLLEKIFKAKWWDYSDDPFNIQGRVCLPYSLLWATGEVIIIKIIHPLVNNIVLNIPNLFGSLLFYTLIIYFFIDFCFTLASLMQFNLFMYPFEFAFNKPNLLSFTKEKTIYKLRIFEYAVEKFKLTNKKFMTNFSSLHSKSLNHIFNSIKKKLKKD